MVISFMISTVKCNAICSELWALRLGIKVAQDLDFPKVIFELDSKAVVDMVHGKTTQISFLQPLLHEITSLLHLPTWDTIVVHIYREENKCANLLANKDILLPTRVCILVLAFLVLVICCMLTLGEFVLLE